ncbi:MAG: GDYXXLXY domain-containing protein [Gordonia sp. (in: high G+C Gram-positive bacteria)]|uniref:GDYXXLXY domain-containing protein n=1 Tax=Gordonia sp. (in: high G+C Gram-positive bacteria) TaxID=84139 RepID=UPI0039E48BFC
MKPDRDLARPVAILLVAAVSIAALVGLVLREAHARSHGTEITVSMRGADPRDLVRGHYVEIRLAESTPPAATCRPRPGEGWIALRNNGTRYVPVGKYDSREGARDNGDIAVRGSLSCTENTTWLSLGPQRFYVNQRDATTIDRALLQGREAAAVLSVGSDGRARLVGLDVDGKRYDLTW